MPFLSCFQMMHLRDDLAEKVQELDEELTLALSELKRLKTANKKHITEVCPSKSMRLFMIIVQCT